MSGPTSQRGAPRQDGPPRTRPATGHGVAERAPFAADLATGYFACVMATGIVSIALLLHGDEGVSRLFFILAGALYAVLIVLYLYRAWAFPRRVWADLTDARAVFGYFTFVAGTDVLGTRVALARQEQIALGLGLVSVVCWAVLSYGVLGVLLVCNREPIERVIDGSWLLTTVSCASLAVLASTLADAGPQDRLWLLFGAYAFWALGVLLYLIVITLILYRFFFLPLTTGDLGPPTWLTMGATAITTLAGSHLVLYSHATPFLLGMRPFVLGVTLLLWVWGSWWIPFLVLLDLWTYGVVRDYLTYDPALWSIVFPLGMYTVACETMGRIDGLHIVQGLVTPFLWIALAAWCAVAALFLWRWVWPRWPRRVGGQEHLERHPG